MFVGGFIGSPAMNFFDCSWNEKEEYLDAASFKLKLPDNLARIVMDNASSAELSLGVRPQNLTVYEKRESPDHVKAEIYAVEPMGSETLVDLKVGDWIVRAVVSGEYMRRIGDEAWIKIDTKKIYLFDRKTEKNIL
jgi:multiple sugar transport system ATP-binding protein